MSSGTIRSTSNVLLITVSNWVSFLQEDSLNGQMPADCLEVTDCVTRPYRHPATIIGSPFSHMKQLHSILHFNILFEDLVGVRTWRGYEIISRNNGASRHVHLHNLVELVRCAYTGMFFLKVWLLLAWISLWSCGNVHKHFNWCIYLAMIIGTSAFSRKMNFNGDLDKSWPWPCYCQLLLVYLMYLGARQLTSQRRILRFCTQNMLLLMDEFIFKCYFFFLCSFMNCDCGLRVVELPTVDSIWRFSWP
jgi:hypothetical protein